MELLNFDWVSQPEAWVALVTLVVLELVLGVDNVITGGDRNNGE